MSPLLDLELLILLAAVNGAPIIAAWLLGRHLALPLDGGRVLADGRPVLGPTKTWRGIFAALLVGTALAPVLGLGTLQGMSIAALSMTGDLASSFVKRRLGTPPSGRFMLLDQLPEALLPLLLLHHGLDLGWPDMLAIGLGFLFLDLALSRLLFRLRIRQRPY
ncbi:MAG: CDP-archaeol synthase [Halothiobacillaceae bacterium]|nr:MAG: CDP-archaeol synthase [Halothiobacillaceae bacterium]